jgi:two-component sensor histidine kinase
MTELIANALRHGGLDTSDMIGLTIDVNDAHVRVDVEQPTRASGVRIVEELERGPSGGFGLVIVDNLSTRWGVETGPPGHVWFEVKHDS